MRNNTESNQAAPSGTNPEVHIRSERLENVTGEVVAEKTVEAARRMVEGMPRRALEVLSGGVISEIILTQIMGESVITMDRLIGLLSIAGVRVRVEGKRRQQ